MSNSKETGEPNDDKEKVAKNAGVREDTFCEFIMCVLLHVFRVLTGQTYLTRPKELIINDLYL